MSLSISARSVEQLEFGQILNLVQSYCKGTAAKNMALELPFQTNLEILTQELRQVLDVKMMITQRESLTYFEYEDVGDALYMLSKSGYVLEVEDVLRILHVLQNYQTFIDHFKGERKARYANYFALGEIAGYSAKPISIISRVFDEKGNVRSNASPELAKIFKKIESISRTIDRTFDDILKRYKNSNFLSDSVESVRNGRRVLILPAENKRRIEGVIQDQSSTGKTVYLEPQETLTLNNELNSLESEKRAEVYRILRALSAELAEHRELIIEIQHRLVQLDIIRAKGVLSHRIDGALPKLSDEVKLHLIDARHPILVLQEESSQIKTVSFDLKLKGDNRLLLISGPNAGGKSVTLKACGLIHLMLYYGLLVPVHEDSEIGMFRQIYTDIGDQQSIDEGLSTYSSHLHNLREILEHATDRTLVLLDEIGSGTDPKLGGAIAEGVLESLLYKKVFGIVTTHYSQLKVYAFRKKGIVNGAMLFDKDNLAPTYRLKVGKPGSSYAFEVAKKVGLDDYVLRYARKKVGKKENQIEELLIDLQEGKAILDEQLSYVDRERKQLDTLIKNYDDMSKRYEIKRKKLQIKAKELEMKRANDENLELQQLINKLEKEKNLEKIRKLKDDARSKRARESNDIIELKQTVVAQKDENEVIRVGDYVKMLDGDLSGEVLKIQNDKATVLFGLMQMEVAIADIRLANTQLEIKTNKSINIKGVAFESNFSPKIDIRGYKITDAEATLEEFFDKALLNNARNLEIVHGKGKGALRKLVLHKIKEYKDISSYHHAADERGGDGVTYVVM